MAPALLNTAQRIGGAPGLAGLVVAALAVNALAVKAGKQQHAEGPAPVHMG
ncbi:hypothetical protein ACWGDT_28860 [Streptomyces avermitilis]